MAFKKTRKLRKRTTKRKTKRTTKRKTNRRKRVRGGMWPFTTKRKVLRYITYSDTFTKVTTKEELDKENIVFITPAIENSDESGLNPLYVTLVALNGAYNDDTSIIDFMKLTDSWARGVNEYKDIKIDQIPDILKDYNQKINTTLKPVYYKFLVNDKTIKNIRKA